MKLISHERQLLGAFITNETPAYLGYGDYRGWVLIDAETGEPIYQMDKRWPNASITFGAPIRNLDYGYLYTVVSIRPYLCHYLH